MGVKGARLIAIVRRWAREIEQDPLLVASILYRYVRGDYLDGEAIPGLRSLLSGPDGPVSPEKPAFDMIVTAGGKELMVEMPFPGAEAFMEPDILETLKNHDPHIDYVGLRRFLSAQGIAAPIWMDPMAKPPSARKPSQNEIRKNETQKIHAEWQAEMNRLQVERPGLFKSDYAGMISRNKKISRDRTAKTIANHTKLNKTNP